jgi:hypothetical protein
VTHAGGAVIARSEALFVTAGDGSDRGGSIWRTINTLYDIGRRYIPAMGQEKSRNAHVERL